MMILIILLSYHFLIIIYYDVVPLLIVEIHSTDCKNIVHIKCNYHWNSKLKNVIEYLAKHEVLIPLNMNRSGYCMRLCENYRVKILTCNLHIHKHRWQCYPHLSWFNLLYVGLDYMFNKMGRFGFEFFIHFIDMMALGWKIFHLSCIWCDSYLTQECHPYTPI